MSSLPQISSPFSSPPSFKTWKLDLEQNILTSFIDSEESLIQSIYLRLAIPRYQYGIYSFIYGSTLSSLIAQSYDSIVTQAPSLIKEILSHDTRITDVCDFAFTQHTDSISISFSVLWDGNPLTIHTTI